MTLRIIEGFDALSDIGVKYTDTYAATLTFDTVNQRTGRACLDISGSSDNIFLNIGGNSNEIYVGFAMQITDTLRAWNLLQFWSNRGATYLRMNSDGTLEIRNLSSLVQASDGVCIIVDTWQYIEIKMIRSNSSSAGDISVKVDGVVVLTLDAGKDTLYSTAIAETWSVQLIGSNDATHCLIDDLYICDGDGSVNNTFLGDVKVMTLYPEGNGNQNDFVGSDVDSVDNYLHVDDVTPDDDSSYVATAGAGDIDLYAFEDMTESASLIHGVALNNVCMRPEIGHTKVARLVCRSGATDYESDDLGIPALQYSTLSKVYETNPADAAAWEEADVNAAEFGLKLQSTS